MRATRHAEHIAIARFQDALASGRPGDPALTEEISGLFAGEQDRIYALCLRIVGHPERARELAQDALLTGWRRLPEFQPKARFGTWLWSIAKNHCFNAVRKRAELLSGDGVLDPASDEADAVSAMRTDERERLIAAASAALSPVEQEVVFLRFVEELPYDQINQLLELPGAGARAVLLADGPVPPSTTKATPSPMRWRPTSGRARRCRR